ncbi:MAG: alpha/beta fold hydrolase BchO [Burkholderiaceae bacterium]
MSARLQWDTDLADWPHAAASTRVTAANMRWHVQIFRHAAEQAPCVLLLHGTGASTHSWRGLIPLLVPHATVLAVDLAGHGFSDMPAGGTASPIFSLPGMARSIGELLAVMRLSPTLVVGHSAGAAIALRMCLEGCAQPRCVTSLNGALAPLEGLAGQLFSPLAKLLARAPGIPELFAWRAGNPRVLYRLMDGTGSKLDSAGREYYRRLISNPGHAAGALGLMANWDLRSLWRDLPQLRTPVQFVVGSNDLIVPPPVSVRASARLLCEPRLPVITLEGLGHLAHEERPDLVLPSLLAVLHSGGSS